MLGCSGGSVKMPVVIAHQRPLALLVLPGQTLQYTGASLHWGICGAVCASPLLWI